jgi:phosphate acetyltransferase
MSEYHNVIWSELEPGATVSLARVLTQAEVETLILFSGDTMPARRPATPESALPSVEAAALEVIVTGLLERRLPGPGTRIVAQHLQFDGRVRAGEPLVATVTLRQKLEREHRAIFDCEVLAGGQQILWGVVEVVAPTERQSGSDAAAQGIIPHRNGVFDRLLQRGQSLEAVTCAVVHPCDEPALLGALESARLGLIVPVLVGPAARIRSVAAACSADITALRIVDTEHSHASAGAAVALARSGEVDTLMKGSLHTDELMGAVVAAKDGLRTERRVSHVFVMDVPAYDRMLLVTDAVINISPTLAEKADIARNAIELATALGVDTPKVAILSAVETVNPDIRSTLDAAALCKMADRGQIRGGLLDGPLAFDNAISDVAARAKDIRSPVAGRADILLVPDIESGNMLAKQLLYFAGADSAGIVLGARVPIVLTSRADNVRMRVGSAAIAKLLVHARRAAPPPRQS